MHRIAVPVWILCADGRIFEGWVYPRTLRVLHRGNARGDSQQDIELVVDAKHGVPSDQILQVQDILARVV